MISKIKTTKNRPIFLLRWTFFPVRLQLQSGPPARGDYHGAHRLPQRLRGRRRRGVGRTSLLPIRRHRQHGLTHGWHKSAHQTFSLSPTGVHWHGQQSADQRAIVQPAQVLLPTIHYNRARQSGDQGGRREKVNWIRKMGRGERIKIHK